MEFFWYTLIGMIAFGILALEWVYRRGQLFLWLIYLAAGGVLFLLVPVLGLPGYWFIVPGVIALLGIGVPVGYFVALAWAAGQMSAEEE